MHVLGKVLLGLTIVLAAADAYLVSVLHGHRRHYLQQIEKRRTDLTQAETNASDLRKRVQEKSDELKRIQTQWGSFAVLGQGGKNKEYRTHVDVPQSQTLNAQTGTIAIAAGATAGIPEPGPDKSLPVVHVFVNEADGASRYLGEFQVAELQANQAVLQSVEQPPLPTMLAALQQLQGQTLRVRELIPASSRSLIDDYFAQHAVLAQQLDLQRNQLQIQTQQLAQSQAILGQRLAELNGDPEPPQGASEQVVKGLVVTIRDEETGRNAELQVLDGLRHDFARKINELNGLVDENQKAVSRLPGYQESLAKPDPRTASNGNR